MTIIAERILRCCWESYSFTPGFHCANIFNLKNDGDITAYGYEASKPGVEIILARLG